MRFSTLIEKQILMKNEIRKAVAIEKSLEDAIFEHFEKAWDAFDAHDWATADTLINKAWTLLPEPKFNNACTTMVLEAMHEFLTKTGKISQLETLFCQWTADLETSGYFIHQTKPFILLAEIYLFKGDFDQAKLQFAKAKKYKASKRDFAEKPAFYFDIMQGKITDNSEIKQLFDKALSANALHTETPTIDEPTNEKIDQLAEQGNEAFDHENYREAIALWEKALNLVPEPQHFYAQSQWLYVSIGDAFFALNDFTAALTHFENAKSNVMENGYHNPFLCLRLGQCFLETGDSDNAKEFLLRAYMIEGEAIFNEDDPKYFDFLKNNVALL